MVDENTKSLLSPLSFFHQFELKGIKLVSALQNPYIFVFMFIDKVEGFVDGIQQCFVFFFLQITLKKKNL